jgi:hypothetical protein
LGWSGYWVIGGEHAGHRAQTVGNTVQSGDVFGVEDYSALAGVIVFEDAADLAGDVGEHIASVAVIMSRLLSTGVKSGQFRVVPSRKDFDDVSVAEPITLPPLDHVAIQIVEEDLFGFFGGLGLDDNFGVLADVTSNIDLPFGHVFSPSERDVPDAPNPLNWCRGGVGCYSSIRHQFPEAAEIEVGDRL